MYIVVVGRGVSGVRQGILLLNNVKIATYFHINLFDIFMWYYKKIGDPEKVTNFSLIGLLWVLDLVIFYVCW